MPENPFGIVNGGGGMTPMAEGFTAMHEMFVGLQAAGFSPGEALTLTTSFVLDAQRAARPCPHCGKTP